jgi:hypothetical protein
LEAIVQLQHLWLSHWKRNYLTINHLLFRVSDMGKPAYLAPNSQSMQKTIEGVYRVALSMICNFFLKISGLRWKPAKT